MTSDRLSWLYGGAGAPADPLVLRAGRLEAVLGDGQLGAVSFDGTELLRGISFLVRDTGWGTYAWSAGIPEISHGSDGFTVAFEMSCSGDGCSFAYRASIAGDSRGNLAFRASGRASTPLLVNRIGFVVLYPLAGTVGRSMHVAHTDGRRETVTIPETVSATLLATNIGKLVHRPRPGLRATVTMTWDAFEMEDQRNWTDASLKAFVRSLSRPYPFPVAAGEVIDQAIELAVAEDSGDRETVFRVTGGGRRARSLMPRIGLAVPLGEAREAGLAAAVAALSPQRLLMRWDPADPQSYPTATTARDLAAACGADVAVELILKPAAPPESQLDAAAKALASIDLVANEVLPFRRDHLTERPAGSAEREASWMAAALAHCRISFPGARVGVGSPISFAELNANPPTIGEADFISHGTSANVHAAGDLPVMETLEAIPHVIASVRALAPGLAYHLGPSGIGMRETPYADAATPRPKGDRMAGSQHDARHDGLFGAAWTLGYLACAISGGVDAVTLADVSGAFGVAGRTPDGALACRPLFQVLRLAAHAQGSQAAADTGTAGIAAIEIREARPPEIWIANLSAVDAVYRFPHQARLHLLDADACGRAGARPDWLTAGPSVDVASEVRLGAYAVGRLVLTQ